jgi:hypothetical protein
MRVISGTEERITVVRDKRKTIRNHKTGDRTVKKHGELNSNREQ